MISLKDIHCQLHAVSFLSQAYSRKRIPHSFILAGPDGVGKSTTAKAYAKILLCHNPVSDADVPESCGKCSSCSLFEADSHPDYFRIHRQLLQFTEGNQTKKNPANLSIHVIRQFVVDTISARPAESQRKLYVIDEAEKLGKPAQNAILKVLEEPPAFCHILLVTSKLDNLLPTILSRCQVLRFGPVDTEIIARRLNQMSLSPDAVNYLAAFADGSLGNAFYLAKLEQNSAGIYESKKAIIDAIASLKPANVLKLAENMTSVAKNISDIANKINPDAGKIDTNRGSRKIVISIVQSAFTDILTLALKPAQKAVNSDQSQAISRIAEKISIDETAQIVADCDESMARVDANANEKLIYERLLLKIAGCDTM
jgi:DNA polymerase-3 subunit delta'